MTEFYRHKGAEIVALMDELNTMPEKCVVDELNSFQVSVYIYGRNHLALVNFLDYFKNHEDSQDLWHQQSIQKQRAFHYEIACLLQNFVASVRALQKHADTIYGTLYRANGKFPDYKARTAEFNNDPVVHFAVKLRDVVLHGETAKTMFRGTMSDDFANNQVGLPLAFFQKHKTWFKGAARAYLDGKTEFVDIPQLVVECNQKVNEFINWFMTHVQLASAEDLGKFQAKERELFLLQVEDALDAWFFNPDPEQNSAPADFGLFHGLFDQSEFDELERFPKGSLGRGDRAVELLEKHYEVPDELKNKIRRAYTDPNFFMWDAFKPLTTDEWEAKYADAVEQPHADAGDAL